MSVKRSDIIKTFSCDGIPVEEWIKKVEMVAKLQKIDDLANFIPLFLEGDAFSIYDQLSDEKKALCGDVKRALISAFSMSPFQAYQAFKDRKLKQAEKPDAFLADLRRLANLFGDETEALLAVQFVDGLPVEVGDQLKSLREGSLDVMKLLESAKLILKDRPEVEIDTRPMAAAGKGVRSGPPSRGKEGGRGTSGQSGPPPRTNNAKYQRPGHEFKDCRVVCYLCKKRGHFVRDCSLLTKLQGVAGVGQGEGSGNSQGEAPEDQGVSPYPMGYLQ